MDRHITYLAAVFGRRKRKSSGLRIPLVITFLIMMPTKLIPEAAFIYELDIKSLGDLICSKRIPSVRIYWFIRLLFELKLSSHSINSFYDKLIQCLWGYKALVLIHSRHIDSLMVTYTESFLKRMPSDDLLILLKHAKLWDFSLFLYAFQCNTKTIQIILTDKT